MCKSTNKLPDICQDRLQGSGNRKGGRIAGQTDGTVYMTVFCQSEQSGIKPFPESGGAVNAHYGIELIISLRLKFQLDTSA